MTPLIPTVPDDENDLRGWLDAAVARGLAPQLADELAAARGGRPGPAAAPGDLGPLVRGGGFAALGDAQLQAALKDPRLLVALAEDAFENGGPYWTRRLAGEPSYDGRAAAGWARVEAALFPATRAVPAPRPRARSLSPWAASLATAAAILAAIFLVPGLRRAPAPAEGARPAETAAWGWQKADRLAAAARPADYLEGLADLADEWKAQDTSTPLALAERIAEFRRGCARVQLADGGPLTEAQRNDLKARCRKWAGTFDRSLAELEADRDAAKVRSEMDATVAKLTAALRADAAKARAAG